MSDNVITLPPRLVAETPPEPYAPAVETLEAELEIARAGDTRAVAVVTVDGVGRIRTSWQGEPGSSHTLFVGIARLQVEFLDVELGNDE